MPKKDDPEFDGKEDKDIKRRGKDRRIESYEPEKYYRSGIYRNDLEYRVSVLERQMKWLLGSSGLSLAILLGAVFWLGGMKSTVTTSSEKVDKMYQIALENKDSLAARTSVIETKLDTIDKKLSNIIPQPGPNTTK